MLLFFRHVIKTLLPALYNTDLDIVTHGGMKVVEVIWGIMDSILERFVILLNSLS